MPERLSRERVEGLGVSRAGESLLEEMIRFRCSSGSSMVTGISSAIAMSATATQDDSGWLTIGALDGTVPCDTREVSIESQHETWIYL